jgi:hypothetical protein
MKHENAYLVEHDRTTHGELDVGTRYGARRSSIGQGKQADAPRVCDRCSAPLCPSRPDHGETWFPDEPICKKHDFTRVKFIRTQRRIRRVALLREQSFTREMLERVVVVRKGIRGLMPGRARKAASAKTEGANTGHKEVED